MSAAREYSALIRKSLTRDYKQMYRIAGGSMRYPFLAPGSASYPDTLWDWDSWLCNVGLRQILMEVDSTEESKQAITYERGCILNFLSCVCWTGWIPIEITRNGSTSTPERPFADNMHKPVLAQHAAFLVRQADDAEWLREHFYSLQAFVNAYRNHYRHQATGLFFWQTDRMIGVDNDPCTFYRPNASSGSIYLNCLMYRELLAMEYLANALHFEDVAIEYQRAADDLKHAVQEHCWDPKDGFFYSVDLNLRPVEHHEHLHSGAPRHWDCLIQRIGVWSGFLALWAQIATPQQAERVVQEHFRNCDTFNAPFGVRTLSKMEKMYRIVASGNPSCWLGPIWGVSNYLTFRGLLHYQYKADATELAEKTVRLFGRDLQRFDALHEYYVPETGEPMLNRGFQDWNYLVLNMLAWLENRAAITEF